MTIFRDLPARPETPRRTWWRNRRILGAAAAVVLVLVVFLIWRSCHRSTAEEQTNVEVSVQVAKAERGTIASVYLIDFIFTLYCKVHALSNAYRTFAIASLRTATSETRGSGTYRCWKRQLMRPVTPNLRHDSLSTASYVILIDRRFV